MPAGSKLHLESEPTRATLNVVFAQISKRLDAIEGKTEPSNRTEPITVEVGKGAAIFAGGFSLNRYGDDLEKSALARGAYVDEGGQWVANQTTSVILEFTGLGGLLVYVNSGLTPGVPFTPTLDTTIT